MWTQTNYDYAKHLVNTNRAEYPYYIAVTNTNVSNNYIYDYPAFYVYLSKEPIKANNRYNYTLPSGSIRYAVNSSNASYNYHTERVGVSNVSGALAVNNYEFVYTNAEFETATIQPDFNASQGIRESTFNGVSVALLIVLLGVLTFRFVRS